MAQAAGFDPTWHYLDEALLGTYGDYVLGLYETLRRNRKPVYSESTYRAPHNAKSVERATFRLMLPLAGVAGTPEAEGLQRLEAKSADLYEIIVDDDPTPARSEHLLTGAGDLTGVGDPVRFVLSGQVFIDHTTSEKRGVLDEGPFDQGLSVFIEGD
ncbi:hypothetical protein [Algihabitans albus]|uniref:hypothetical protein n=1 Tax=Algihabitans albus TaxID=2164067 RepID=UPI0013C2EF3F|nr:hypothetical protein [Algihabitans albus]